MNRIICIALLAFGLTSCQQKDGHLRGVISYIYNDKSGNKPDVGAKIYAIYCDSLPKSVFSEVHLMIQHEQYHTSYILNRKQFKLDSLDWATMHASDKYMKGQPAYEEYLKNQQSAMRLDSSMAAINKSWLIKHNIFDFLQYGKADSIAAKNKSDLVQNDHTHYATADGNGNYSMALKPGKYYVMIASGNRKGTDLFSIDGLKDIAEVEIAPEKETVRSHNFDIVR